jgi:ABC-type dipeptide/oligopeptide/nickel transport system permease component
MLSYIIRRILHGIVVIFFISIATFGLMHLAPGDPVTVLVGEAQVTQEQLDNIRRQWGLDRPWYEQYFTWLSNMARGDFGVSMVRTGMPVSQMLLEAAPVTLKLNLWAFGVATVVAVPVGVLAAVRRNSWIDYSSMVGSTLGVSIPSFWLALVVIIIFALHLGWLPSTGMGSWKHYILPVGVLAIEQMALIARLSRSSTLEVLRQDYVNVAVAKGLAWWRVIVRHVVRNAMLPVVTVLGIRIAWLLSGTIIVETIFAWPGLGRLFMTSIHRLDYQVVQAIVLLSAVLVIVANILTDIVYAFIDPRIRLQ